MSSHPASVIYSKPAIIGAACLLGLFLFVHHSSKTNFEVGNVSNVEIKVHNTLEAEVISYVQQRHLFPHNPDLPTNYTPWTPNWANLKQRMSHYVIERFGNKRGGFFIECGAFDGLALSNSLLLEREYGWTGLLVEADPILQEVLKSRNRHAWVADVCLSTASTPIKVTMAGSENAQWNAGSNIKNDVLGDTGGTRKFDVECYPLSMLLDAIGRDQVDYFSLDIEGVELDVLKTIPFHRIKIKLINVEVRPGNKEAIKAHMEMVGYQRILEMVDNSESIHDDVYELIE